MPECKKNKVQRGFTALPLPPQPTRQMACVFLLALFKHLIFARGQLPQPYEDAVEQSAAVFGAKNTKALRLRKVGKGPIT